MLELKVSRDKINKYATELYVADITGNYGDLYYLKDGDGNWQQHTNETGYGSPNPIKSSLAILFLSVYKGSKKESILLPKVYTATDSLFKLATFDYSQDGWYRYYLIGVPIFDSNVVYSLGNFAFHPDVDADPYNGAVKKWDGVEWKVVTVEEMIGAEYDNLPHRTYKDDLLQAKSLLYRAKKNNEFANESMKNPGCNDPKGYLNEKERDLEFLSKQARTAFCNGLKTEAQRWTEAANKIMK